MAELDDMKSLDDLIVCAVPCNIYGVGDDVVCVRHPDGAVLSLEQSHAQVLMTMSSPKPVRDWIEFIRNQENPRRLSHHNASRHIVHRFLHRLSTLTADANNGGSTTGNRDEYEHYLAIIFSLHSKGLLFTDKQFSDHRSGLVRSTESSCRIQALCIPTCSRNSYLRSCLNTFIPNMIEHGRTDASVFVIDDSQDRASQSDGRAMLSTLKTSGGPELRFIGYEERHALVSKLHRKRAAPPEVLDFAFCPEKLLTTEGAARNCIMLLTSGMFILQTDDDTSCAYVSATNQDNTLRISALPDPNQTRFYADRRSNLDNSPLSRNLDPFAIHESILGQSLTNLVSARDNVSWQDIDSYALSCFITGPGRIDITVTGASGDPGTGSSMGFLTIAPDDTIEQIYSNPNTYRWATAGREVLKAVSNTTVSKGMYFQAMSFGINNSRLQPPFFPWGRNLDGAFAHLYLKSDPQAWIGHLPYSISHESEPGRGYTGTPASDASTVRLTDILQICMGQIKVTPDQSTGQALRSIAEQLISVGSMSPRLFSSYVRCVYIQSRFELLAFLDLRVARSFVKHQQWHDEIREMSKRIRQSMIEPDNIVPVDLRKTFGVDHSLEIARLSILRYGMLIKYWEDITSIASSSSQLS